MAPPPRKVVIDIVSARNLMPKDGSGSASAFCTLDYDGNRRKTKTKPRDLNPTWGEKFEFPITDLTIPGCLEINIYNERKGGTRRHGFLGRVHFWVGGMSALTHHLKPELQDFGLRILVNLP